MQEEMMMRENRRGRVQARERWGAAKDNADGGGLNALFRVAKEGTSEAKLLRACQEGDTAAMVQCVEAGANAHSAVDSKQKLTAIHWAARNGHEDVVEKLLDHGVNAATAKYKWLVLHLAAREGHEGVVRALVESGACPVDQKDREDWTALHWAARRGHGRVVGRLIKMTADCNLKNRFGHTALHEAVVWGHRRCVKELRLGGAPVHAENENFEKAEDLCRDEEILALLYDPKLDPIGAGDQNAPDVEELMRQEAEDDNSFVDPEYVWDMVDRNRDGSVGRTELRRAITTNQEAMRFVRKALEVYELEAGDIVKKIFKELKKNDKEDVTKKEFIEYFSNTDDMIEWQEQKKRKQAA